MPGERSREEAVVAFWLASFPDTSERRKHHHPDAHAHASARDKHLRGGPHYRHHQWHPYLLAFLKEVSCLNWRLAEPILISRRSGETAGATVRNSRTPLAQFCAAQVTAFVTEPGEATVLSFKAIPIFEAAELPDVATDCLMFPVFEVAAPVF